MPDRGRSGREQTERWGHSALPANHTAWRRRGRHPGRPGQHQQGRTGFSAPSGPLTPRARARSMFNRGKGRSRATGFSAHRRRPSRSPQRQWAGSEVLVRSRRRPSGAMTLQECPPRGGAFGKRPEADVQRSDQWGGRRRLSLAEARPATFGHRAERGESGSTRWSRRRPRHRACR